MQVSPLAATAAAGQRVAPLSPASPQTAAIRVVTAAKEALAEKISSVITKETEDQLGTLAAVMRAATSRLTGAVHRVTKSGVLGAIDLFDSATCEVVADRYVASVEADTLVKRPWDAESVGRTLAAWRAGMVVQQNLDLGKCKAALRSRALQELSMYLGLDPAFAGERARSCARRCMCLRRPSR